MNKKITKNTFEKTQKSTKSTFFSKFFYLYIYPPDSQESNGGVNI